MSTYAEITDQAAAEAHVAALLAKLSSRVGAQGARDMLREDATDEWCRASGSVLPDAGARSLGASLVILTLNRLEGAQR